MKEEYCKFIESNGLSPFNKPKTQLNLIPNSIYKTRDGKTVHNKLLTKISSNFNFPDSSNLWHCLPFTNNPNEIKRRQEFFKNLQNIGPTKFLNQIKKPRPNWSPKYEIAVVTEDESTFVKLNELDCTAKLLVSENDLSDLDRYDIIQVIDCDLFQRALESLPQTVFIKDLDNVYLERYLEELSGWVENLKIIMENNPDGEIKKITEELITLFPLINKQVSRIITKEEVEKTLEEINLVIEEKLKDTIISGANLIKIMSEGKLPEDFKKIINDTIDENKLPSHIFNISIPVSVDEKELEDLIRRQSANEFTDIAEEVKSRAEIVKQIPKKLTRLSELLLVLDFLGGISDYIKNTESYPEISKELHLNNSKNYFLENPQPVSFNLSGNYKCSILTGANSGGKTTLLEHLIQLISLFQLGLPISGEFSTPLFTDVYYFAKNKGAANKGAFENLLTQMAGIKPGNQTLILADEIEAVTEPGVAGKIIASTSEYFLRQNCFLVIATHLGYEIKEVLPEKARIDGIEAKGLDENFNLIVDHNPVLGRLAHSTPELIVEKMANSNDSEYFRHLNNSLKKSNQTQKS
jgi:DNA mismatch repair protein MutS2